MTLSSLSFGKIEATLSNRQILAAVAANDMYLDAVGKRAALRSGPRQVIEVTTPTLVDDTAFKFTDDDGVRYWTGGSFLLRSALDYRSIENAMARDEREGDGHLYLEGRHRFVTMSATAGFNAYVVCTSADARKSERQHRHQKFGCRLIKIHGVQEFARKVALAAGAIRHQVRDVVYSNSAVVRAANSKVDEWVDRNGVGDLKPSFLEYLARHHLDDLMVVSETATLFTKPTTFRTERERRLMFVMPMDVKAPMPIESRALASHIEVLT